MNLGVDMSKMLLYFVFMSAFTVYGRLKFALNCVENKKVEWLNKYIYIQREREREGERKREEYDMIVV